MTSLRQTLRSARRRTLANRCLHGAGIGFVGAAGAALVVLAVDRLMALGLPLLAFAGIVAGGALVGMIIAALRPPRSLDVAIHLDRAMRLKDRFGTAVALESPAARRTSDDFAPLVERDAEHFASRLDVRNATPIRVTGVWGAAASLAFVLWLGVAFLPSVSRADPAPDPDAPTPEEIAAVEAQRETIVKSIDSVIEDLGDEAATDETTRQQLEALDRLAQQLAAAEPDESALAAGRDETASRLNELADHLQDEATRDAAAADEVARRFSGLSNPDAPMTTQEFLEALKRGEFGDAAKVLEQMTEGLESMPEAERRALAEELRNLSEQLKEPGAPGASELDERAAQLRQALRDQGLDDATIDDLLGEEAPAEPSAPEAGPESPPETDTPSPPDTGPRPATEPAESPRPDPAEILRRENVDEEIARQVERDLEQLQRERDVQRRAEQEVESIRKDLERAADQIEQPPPPKDQAQPGQQQDPDAPKQPGQQQDPNAPTQPGQQQDPNAPKQPGQQQDPDAPKQPGQVPDPDQPRETGGQAPSGQEPQPGSEPPTPPDAETLRQVAERLKKLSDRRGPGDQRQEMSERLKQLAREMADNMTEEERQQWAEQWQRQFGAEPVDPDSRGTGDGIGTGDGRRLSSAPPDRPAIDTEDLDLAGDESSEQVIAEWLSPGAGPAEPGRTDRAAAAQRLERARRVAERAVNDSAVPSRYHDLIKRYFDQVNKNFEKATPPAAPPAAGGTASDGS